MKISMGSIFFSKICSDQVFYLRSNYLYSEAHQDPRVRTVSTSFLEFSSKMLFSIGNPTISKSKENQWIILIPLTFSVHPSQFRYPPWRAASRCVFFSIAIRGGAKCSLFPPDVFFLGRPKKICRRK